MSADLILNLLNEFNNIILFNELNSVMNLHKFVVIIVYSENVLDFSYI